MTRIRFRRSLATLCIILLAALALSACGQSPAPAAKPAAPAPAAAPVAAPAAKAAEPAAAAKPAAPAGTPLADIKGQLRLATGGVAAAIHNVGSAWAAQMNSKTKVQGTVVATGGSLENARLLMGGQTEIAFVVTPQAAEAKAGIGDFKDQADKFKNARAIAAYSYGGIQIVVPAASGIKSVSDFKGKRVSVGAPGSAALGYSEKLFALYGLTEKDYQRRILANTASSAGLRDGTLDGWSSFIPAPVAIVAEIANSIPISLIPVDADKIKAFVAQTPGFFPGEFRPDAYRNQKNTGPIPVPYSTITVYSHTGVSEDMVYAATKSLFDNLKDLQAATADAKVINPDSAFTSLVSPLHKGALRYYKEAGKQVPADLIPPEAK